MASIKIHSYNEYSLLMQFEENPMELAYCKVEHWYAYAKFNWKERLSDIVPAYDSLLLICKSAEDARFLNEAISQSDDIVKIDTGSENRNLITIPVCYDINLKNDLAHMQAYHGISKDSIIQIHTSSIYRVYMLGFLPGFAYMGEVDLSIATPRKSVPVSTKAGAVGIAGRQTGIYPLNSMGGWNIVGYTPLKMFDISNKEPALLQPGNTVRFEAIDLESYFNYNL